MYEVGPPLHGRLTLLTKEGTTRVAVKALNLLPDPEIDSGRDELSRLDLDIGRVVDGRWKPCALG